jgi:23S rRNA pseudouridine2605 synthase
MMHPRFAVEREYAVRIVGQLKPEQIRRLEQGIPLSDGMAKCESVADEGGEGTNHWYRIVLKEGRNRVVRRLFEALGLTVSRLIRVRFGVVALPPRLKRGQVNPLTTAEVKELLDWLEVHAPAPASRDEEPEPATPVA